MEGGEVVLRHLLPGGVVVHPPGRVVPLVDEQRRGVLRAGGAGRVLQRKGGTAQNRGQWQNQSPPKKNILVNHGTRREKKCV